MTNANEPIAIIGAGAVFPGAGSAAELWRNVLDGFDPTLSLNLYVRP